MANTITGKVWSLDTAAGVVTTDPVCLHSIRVRFTTAAAGSFVIKTCPIEKQDSGYTILDLKTTAATSAAAWSLDKEYFFGDQTFQGLTKTLSVSVDTVYVVTGIPK